MTELAIREAHGVVVPEYRPAQVAERDIIDGWIQVLGDVSNLANFISETDFVPKSLRNRPAAIAAAILTGRELGIGPMQSLKAIHMVQGVPSLSAEYKRARALAAGHEIVFDETNSTRCVVRGRRAGSDRWVTVQWTMDMAGRAKLNGKDVWRQYPQRMLQARASSELCDILFPDASLGLATSEILEDGGIVTESGETVDAATGEITSGPAVAEPKPRTARRARASSSPAPAAPMAAPVTPPAQGAGEALSPLPGEDEPGPPAAAAAPATGTAAAATAPDDTDYDTPGTVTPQQITKIWVVLTKEFDFGSTEAEKDRARLVCAHIVNRDLASTKALSRNEASGILDTLAHWQHQAEKQGGHPAGYMLELMAAQDEAAESE